MQPLAWAIVFGLSFATIATLFVTPSLLALPEKLKSMISRRNRITSSSVVREEAI